ncbi:hypothetical protein ES703_119544 [subsurface metagenome]
MSWRKHTTHREETKAVKAALAAAGIPAKVGHGKGTAWSWLEINIGKDLYPDENSPRLSQEWRERHNKALMIAVEASGRTAESGREILILTQ